VGEARRRAGSACTVGFGERFLARCEGEARGKHFFWCGWISSADCLWDRATCGAEARGRGRTHDGADESTNEFFSPLHTF
jgi:hypothetical protein